MRETLIGALAALTMIGLAPDRVLEAAELQPDTAAAWDAYVRAAEARMATQLRAGRVLLDAEIGNDPAEARAVMGSGGISVSKVTDAASADIPVPGGMVHHWRGRVYIPGTTVERILDRVANPRPADTDQEDVLESRVLERQPGSLRLFLKLQRSQIVTVVYNTEHAVQYRRLGPHGVSRSVATRIAEVVHAGTPEERERAPGHDRGFLWRLNSYWRYQQVDGGVIVECESISLSRSVPGLVRAAVQPLIDTVARGSMERTLSSMRQRFADSPVGGPTGL